VTRPQPLLAQTDHRFRAYTFIYERSGHHLLPYRTLIERRTTTAEPVLDQASVPHIPQFAYQKELFYLT